MIDAKTSVGSPASSDIAPRLRLHYLDGLRGLAALYVVIYHGYMQVEYKLFTSSLPAIARLAMHLLSFGHLAVAVFIVLSGYCLMLPVARSADSKLSGSVIRFFQRRAMRILPPYYAAFLLCLLLIRFVPALAKPSAANWNIALPAFTPGIIISHLLLVHNLSPNWIFKIDYPMWSVATEWQIYFLFPLLMLPVWQRFGIVALLAAVFAFWMAIHLLFHARFDGAGLHLASLFSFGMAGAIAGFSQKPQVIAWRERIPWGLCTLVSFAALAGLLSWHRELIEKHTSHIDLLAGLCATCLIIYCTQHLMMKKTSRPAVLAIMESGFAVGIGRFSYSLYLIHAPVLALCYAALRGLHLDPIITLGLVILSGVPLSLLVSYLFFLACERPFFGKAKRVRAGEGSHLGDVFMTIRPFKQLVKQAAARLAPEAASAWQNARERRHIRRFEQRMGLNILRTSYLTQHELSVASGPFVGMKYLSEAVCSALIPKLVGSYEAELHGIITQALSKGYTAVIDVGCAEGYYANGFALRLPTTPVYAFDIDVQARKLCAALSALNNLQDQVIVSGKCDPMGLNALLTSCSLLICDCEGYEEELLRPELAPALSQTDILVELHDHIRPGVSLLLQKRFEKTHQVTLVTATKRDPAEYPKLLLSKASDRDLAVSEFRTANQQWAFFQAKSQSASL